MSNTAFRPVKSEQDCKSSKVACTQYARHKSWVMRSLFRASRAIEEGSNKSLILNTIEGGAVSRYHADFLGLVAVVAAGRCNVDGYEMK